jgi:hypothetical protein
LEINTFFKQPIRTYFLDNLCINRQTAVEAIWMDVSIKGETGRERIINKKKYGKFIDTHTGRYIHK